MGRAVRMATVPVLAAVVLAGCGGGSGPVPGSGSIGDPNCEATVRDALTRLTGVQEVHTRLVATDALADTSKCAYRAGRERVTVHVDSTGRARQAFEAARPHHVERRRDGRVLSAWLPADRQAITTNATRRRGGAFVRVTVEERAKGAPSDRKVARSVARAALRTAPRAPHATP